MSAIILAYVGGVLTILSPCILPVLPFIFSRVGQSFFRFGLPMLAGMALTFTVFASLAAVSGEWTITTNNAGRTVALVIMAFFASALLFPGLAERIARPFVATGNKLLNFSTMKKQPGIYGALLTGVATGLLWTPCAGPILGLVLTGAAVQGANIGSSLLLLSYALGAATSLAMALLAGNKVFTMMKNSTKNLEWIKRGLGAAMLLGVVAILYGFDREILSKMSIIPTNVIEQKLLGKMSDLTTPQAKHISNAPQYAEKVNVTYFPTEKVSEVLPVLTDKGEMPPFDGATQWLNSPPLSAQALRGNVVLVHFWTFACINCQRSLPYVNSWAKKYRDKGLVVIGIHSPEFAFEKDPNSVRREADKLSIDYPVAIDNSFTIWKAYNNNYWPAHYFIDVKGNIRYIHIGEGDYGQSERVIQELLGEVEKII